jgi:opacity protein-like surface antigen
MRVKQLLLASTALALLGGAQQAQAGMYVSVFGGANWLENSSGQATNFFGGKLSPTFTTILGFHSDADTGFLLGGAVGVHLDHWVNGLRAEIEVSYRRQDVGGHWNFTAIGRTTFNSTGAIHANQSTFAIMANVWYDIDCGWKFVPYFGGGAGWARSKVDGALLSSSGFTPTSTPFNVEANGFAWQLGVGFNYEVQPGVNLGLGYRYFEGPDNEVFFQGKFGFPGLSTEFTNRNHSVLLNLSVDIN